MLDSEPKLNARFIIVINSYNVNGVDVNRVT